MPGPSASRMRSVSAASVSLTRLSAKPTCTSTYSPGSVDVLTDQQGRVDPPLHTAELHLAVHVVVVDVLDETGGNR